MCLSSRALLYFCLVVLLGSSNAVPGVQQVYGPMEMLATGTATGIPVLNPACIEKYHDTLILPPVMPKSAVKVGQDEYQISVRQVSQNVLPSVLPAGIPPATCAGYVPGQQTRVYGYGTTATGVPTHNWPGFTIEATRNRPAKVVWANELLDPITGQYLPHLLKDSIDQTLHWANPGGLGLDGIDSSPCMRCMMAGNCINDTACVLAASTIYNGPVPIVTHLHGNVMAYDFSDGWSEAWYMPNATNLITYSPVGSWYNPFSQSAFTQLQDVWTKGSATFTYKNAQNPTQMWYHDHVIGLTRLNVYAGLAGLYNLRAVGVAQGPELPGLPWPPPGVGFLDNKVREIPVVIQDRIFDITGQLHYPINILNRQSVLPNGPVPPKWIPELLGITTTGQPINTPGAVSAATMVVNGKTWPKFAVSHEPYRIRLLNGCNARTVIVYLSTIQPTTAQLIIPPAQRLDMYVIGNEAGFFPSIVGPVRSLLLGPAERYDVIVDFSQLLPGVGVQQVYLLNEGPEMPYNGINNGELLTENTAQVMRFDVQPGATGKNFTASVKPLLDPALAAAYNPVNNAPAGLLRKFTLTENRDAAGNSVAMYLGQATVVAGVNVAIQKAWSDAVTTNAAENSTEDWELINLTADVHPIHIHEVNFQVVNQRSILVTAINGQVSWNETGLPLNPLLNKEAILSAPSGATGVSCLLQKDTVLVPPSSITTVRLKTSTRGLFPWHCHLLEHEDNEMMRPWCVGQPGYLNPKTNTLMCPGPPGIPPL